MILTFRLWFSFFIYHICIKCRWKPDYTTLSRVDSHLQTHVFLNLKFLLFLTIVQPNYFSLFLWGRGVTEFYILSAIVICCHLQAPALHNHHEQETLPPACVLCMAGQVSDHFLTPYASPPAWLLCFQCHWSLFVWLFPPFTIVLFRNMASRSNGFLLCFG